MSEVRVIDVNMGVMEQNDRIAALIRRQNRENHTCMVNLMASPGAGKTTTLMFQVCQAVLVNKIDTRKFFRFDDEAFVQRVHDPNPEAEIFFLSAKTGEGFDAWLQWLKARL